MPHFNVFKYISVSGEFSSVFFPIMSFKIRGKMQFLSNIKFH